MHQQRSAPPIDLNSTPTTLNYNNSLPSSQAVAASFLALSGQPVRPRFVMKDADVFALQFAP